ncbi:MAG TPA: SAM-dependent methyltransferase [Bacteroidales bacterium]|nr:SAM-dependent methyltransferase [Bacteroidales bacterium]
MESDSTISSLWQALKMAVQQNALIKLVLSKPRKKQSGPKRLSLRPVIIKGSVMLQLTEHFERQEIAKNFLPEEGITMARKRFDEQFLEANLFTAGEHLQVLTNAKGHMKLLRKSLKQVEEVSLSHDKEKKRHIKPTGIHWHRLGLTDATGQVLPSMQFKFKQIHQYIAILEPLLEPLLKSETLRVTDMGAGKGYLTFALYEYLRDRFGGQLHVTGVEQRPELVALTNALAEAAGFGGLSFAQGAIESYDATGTDVLIALHACDTATDDAIASGIKADVQLMVCAPCCHKQLRRSMLNQGSMPMLSYGILWERQAEILTDTIRALIMEKYGYKSHIQEFIEIGHTPKNLLLTGIKTKRTPDIHQLDEKISGLKTQFGITRHYLEELLEKNT